MVRLSLEQRDDVLVLVILQPKLTVERLIDDGAQDVSLSAAGVGPSRLPTRLGRSVRSSVMPATPRCSSPWPRSGARAISSSSSGSRADSRRHAHGGSRRDRDRILLAFLAATIGDRPRARELGELVAAAGPSLESSATRSLLARRLGGDAHRLGDRRDRAGNRPPVHDRARPAIPSSRADGRRRWAGVRDGARGRHRPHRSRSRGNRWLIVGTLAVVLSSLAYAIGNVVGQRSVASAAGPVLACGAMLATTVVLAPGRALPASRQQPDRQGDRGAACARDSSAPRWRSCSSTACSACLAAAG